MWSKVKSDPKNWIHHLLIIDWFLYLGFWIRTISLERGFSGHRVRELTCLVNTLIKMLRRFNEFGISWVADPCRVGTAYIWIQMRPRSPKLLNLPYHKPILRSNWQPINGSRAFSKTFCRCPSRLRLRAGRIISYKELFQDHYIRVSL